MAPDGYRALGTVCVSRPDQPKLEQALCVRSDHVEPSSSFESPIWTHRPPELSQVVCFVLLTCLCFRLALTFYDFGNHVSFCPARRDSDWLVGGCAG